MIDLKKLSMGQLSELLGSVNTDIINYRIRKRNDLMATTEHVAAIGHNAVNALGIIAITAMHLFGKLDPFAASGIVAAICGVWTWGSVTSKKLDHAARSIPPPPKVTLESHLFLMTMAVSLIFVNN